MRAADERVARSSVVFATTTPHHYCCNNSLLSRDVHAYARGSNDGAAGQPATKHIRGATTMVHVQHACVRTCVSWYSTLYYHACTYTRRQMPSRRQTAARCAESAKNARLFSGCLMLPLATLPPRFFLLRRQSSLGRLRVVFLLFSTIKLCVQALHVTPVSRQ
jgi:hypothetical protein